MGNDLSCQTCRVEDDSVVEFTVESDYHCSELVVKKHGVAAQLHCDDQFKVSVLEDTPELQRLKSNLARENSSTSTRTPYSSDDVSEDGSIPEAHQPPLDMLSAEHKQDELLEWAAGEANDCDECCEPRVQVAAPASLREKTSSCDKRQERCRSRSSERGRSRLPCVSGMFHRKARDESVGTTQGCEAAEVQPAQSPVLRLERTSALDKSFGELPDPQVVLQSLRNKKPAFTQYLPDVSLAAVRDALEVDGGCLHRYPCEALNCNAMSATTWNNTGAVHVQHLAYKLTVPRDFPDFVYKMLGLPEVVDGATVSCISTSGHAGSEFVLLQRSRTDGVPYSDRLQAENVYCFKADANGQGVTMMQWTEVIWTQPCPWTMRPIAAVIEKKVKGEAKATAPDFHLILQDVIMKQHCADH